MENLAISTDVFRIYWSSIITALAVFCAVVSFLSIYKNDKRYYEKQLFVVLSIIISLIFARLLHWYLKIDAYESLEMAFTKFYEGGYALIGVFFGTALVALLFRLFGITKNLRKLLDAAAISAALGISIGRLAARYLISNRGFVVEEYVPFLTTIIKDPVSGSEEIRFACFYAQAVACFLIAVYLMIYYSYNNKRQKYTDGDVFFRFVVLYSASQMLLDSTRYDSLYLRSNGFVSLVQICSGSILILLIIISFIRVLISSWKTVKKGKQFLIFFLGLLSAAFCGFMEYYVQRHGDRYIFAYSMMFLALVEIVFVIFSFQNTVQSSKEALVK
jgi:prolipoprotein diacylglyceryltransferase